MLKWAMRIAAVSGALLAMAVGTAAWMHRTHERVWCAATTGVWTEFTISPKYCQARRWRRPESIFDDPKEDHYSMNRADLDEWSVRSMFHLELVNAASFGTSWDGFGADWHGFGILHGTARSSPISGFTAILCPTWSLITVLLLPIGLWTGIGYLQRRQAAAGHCTNCGYDLRASPERCPECGREVKTSAER